MLLLQHRRVCKTETMAYEAIKHFETASPDKDYWTLLSLKKSRLGSTMEGKLTEAEALYREALTMARN